MLNGIIHNKQKLPVINLLFLSGGFLNSNAQWISPSATDIDLAKACMCIDRSDDALVKNSRTAQPVIIISMGLQSIVASFSAFNANYLAPPETN